MYRLVISMVLMLLVAIFAIQNKDVVHVAFLAWVVPVPSVLLVLGSVTLGAVLTGLLSAFKQFGMGRKAREYQNKIKYLEDEMKKLKDQSGPADHSATNGVSTGASSDRVKGSEEINSL